MKNQKPAERLAVTIKQLYPELTSEQQEEAAYRLDQYLAIIKRIYERKLRLTVSGRNPKL